MSLRPASKARGGSLAPIKERDEYTRSADPSVSQSRKMAAAQAAKQMAPAHNRPSGYKATNTGDERQAAQQLPPRQARNGGRNPAVAQHRSPVIPSGKEQLQLPPLDPTARARVAHGSANRAHGSANRYQDQNANMRNNGAAIMASNHIYASARNLQAQRSGSRNGSDGVRDSLSMGQRKY